MMFMEAGMDLANMTWELKCREEDMKQRALEVERWATDDVRRLVDERSQQLKILGRQSALIAGISMVVLVEIRIPSDLNHVLLVAFGSTTASVVGLMLLSTLNATHALVSTLRYDAVTREVPFSEFWETRCDDNYKFALQCFGLGVPLFMMVLAQVGWVVFWNHTNARLYAGSIITLIAVVTGVLYLGWTQRKWSAWLLAREVTLLNPNA